MIKNTPFWRLVFANLIGAGLLFVAWMYGDIQKIYHDDVSHITLIMIPIFLFGLFSLFRAAWLHRRPAAVTFLSTALVMLGLIGTVIGFRRALTIIESGSTGAGDVVTTTTNLITGMGISLSATLTGAVLSLWLLFGYWLSIDRTRNESA